MRELMYRTTLVILSYKAWEDVVNKYCAVEYNILDENTVYIFAFTFTFTFTAHLTLLNCTCAKRL
jgi:hypothetical protein